MLERTQYTAGNSLLERLPNELLFKIVASLVIQELPTLSSPRAWFMHENLPADPNTIPQTHSLLPCLLVSNRMHDIALPLLYRDVKLVQREPSGQCSQNSFLQSIDENPGLVALVRSLNIAEYEAQSLRSTLARALPLLPRLRSIHVQLGELKSLDSEDIHKIIFGLPDLENLVIENTDGKTQPSSLAGVLRCLELVDQTVFSNIHSLTIRNELGPLSSLTPHGLPLFDPDLYRKFLPRFSKLRTLDLAYTSINPNALFAINSNTRLQYLRVSTCRENDTCTLARFLATHPAVKYSLVIFDGTGVRFREQDTTNILENLPSTLRSLNLSSSIMTENHVPHLQRLCRHIEELSVGHGLGMENVEAVILVPSFSFDAHNPSCSINGRRSSRETLQQDIVLGPMRDAIAVCELRRRLGSLSPNPTRSSIGRSRVKYLNLSSMDQEEQARISSSVLLGRQSMPLECIEVSGVGPDDYQGLRKVCAGCGWRDKWVCGMVWLERR